MNSVNLLGRICNDIELKHTPAGVSVCTFTVAVDRGYVKKDGERKTDFIDVVAWRKTAEFVAKYFRKGNMIALNGQIQTRTYEDKDTGKKRKVFEIVADKVSFAGNNSMDVNPDPSREDEDFSVVEGDEDLPF